MLVLTNRTGVFAIALFVCFTTNSAVRAGDKAGPHAVVPGFERFHTKEGADPVKGGRLLLGELNCTSCHTAGANLEAYITPRQAPILDGVGQRIQRSYLRKFIADPQTVKPGTSMPGM